MLHYYISVVTGEEPRVLDEIILFTRELVPFVNTNVREYRKYLYLLHAEVNR
jgi:hypothetical protein